MNHISSRWPMPARAPTAHSSSSPRCHLRGYRTVTPSSVKSSTLTPARLLTSSTPCQPARRISRSTTSSSRPSKLPNSKELPHTMSSGPSFGAYQDPSAEQPVCPRHPDRVTYVRCQRCNRPVYGACQPPSRVGVLCFDCVRAPPPALPPQQRTAKSTDRHRRAAPLATYMRSGLTTFVNGLQWAGQFI